MADRVVASASIAASSPAALVQRHVARGKLTHRTLAHQCTQRSLNIAGSKIQRRNNIGKRNRQCLQRQPRVNRTGNISGFERRIQRALPVGKLTRATAARQQYAPTANEHHRRVRQHHGMIAGAQRQRVLQTNLNGSRLAHRHRRLALHEHDAADDLGRSRHHVHARARLEHARLGALAAQVGQRHHKAQRLAKTALHAEHLTAIERRDAIAHQVERHALTGQRPLRIAMHLNSAHAADRARRQRNELIAHGNRCVVQGSRHDGAGALDRKAAVDRQARRGIGSLGSIATGAPTGIHAIVKRGQQRINPLARLGRHGNDRRTRKHRARQKVIDVKLGKLGHLGIGQVAHRLRDHHVRDAQQLQHVHVLARLRHHTLDGRYNQHGHIDARGALHHGAQVVRMSRHVDQAHDLAARQGQLAKAELHGHAAATLDLQAVGILARQRLDECRLAVVDMARRAHDDGAFHQLLILTHRRAALATHAASVEAAVSISRSPTSVRTSNKMRSCEVRVTTGVSKS